MMVKHKAIFAGETEPKGRVYGDIIPDEIAEVTEFLPRFYTKDDLTDGKEHAELKDVEFIFSTWGMVMLTEERIAALFPSLKAVFYAAGTVQYFARPFLKKGVRVFSAWAANAVPVAEYTVAQIVLANKGFFRSFPAAGAGDRKTASALASGYPGNYGACVGLIGAGMIGGLVARMLKSYDVKVLAFDKFLSDEKAAELGVEKATLQRIFTECTVVSNHLANNAQTKGMLDGGLFASMRPGAVFLNTGRGAQVKEDELIAVLEKRGDLTAILDVTEPEPPVAGSRFYSLPNVILTPHIAGSSGNEVRRMAEYMYAEYLRVLSGETPLYEVTEKMLETMA